MMDTGEAKPITENILFYGDHLAMLRESIDTESVDLLYLALHSCIWQNFIVLSYCSEEKVHMN